MKISQNVLSQKEKVKIAALLLWSFVHSYIIIRNNIGYGSTVQQGIKLLIIDKHPVMENPVEYFYPLYMWKHFFLYSEICYYDYTEYFVYVVGAWLIYFLYRFLKK